MNIRPEIAGVWDYLYWNLAMRSAAALASVLFPAPDGPSTATA